MKYKDLSSFDKRLCRKYVIKELRYRRVHSIEGRKLTGCKNTKLFATYLSETGVDIVDEFRTRRKECPEMGYVYVIGNTHAEVCKIGFSKTPNKRLKGIQTGCPYPIKILYLFVGSINLEKQLHKKYSKYRLNGEWFSYTGELRNALENSKESVL